MCGIKQGRVIDPGNATRARGNGLSKTHGCLAPGGLCVKKHQGLQLVTFTILADGNVPFVERAGGEGKARLRDELTVSSAALMASMQPTQSSPV